MPARPTKGELQACLAHLEDRDTSLRVETETRRLVPGNREASYERLKEIELERVRIFTLRELLAALETDEGWQSWKVAMMKKRGG